MLNKFNQCLNNPSIESNWRKKSVKLSENKDYNNVEDLTNYMEVRFNAILISLHILMYS